MLFNPSLEIQTTDNFVDWASLSVVNLENITWSSRSIPQGTESEIDVLTLTFSTPIYIRPPVKVKQLGVITQIAMSIGDEERGTIETGINIPGDSILFPGWDQESPKGFKANIGLNPDDWHLLVLGGTSQLVNPMGLQSGPELEKPTPTGTKGNWQGILDAMGGQYRAGLSKMFLKRPDTKAPIVGYITLNPLDERSLVINWDEDTLPTNTLIQGPTRSDGNINAVVDPQKSLPNIVPGIRFLLTGDIGDVGNIDGPDAWKNIDGSDFVAKANDIIEWDGTKWTVIFESNTTSDITYVTNINPNSGLQFKWDGEQWIKAWEGIYEPGSWQIIL